MKPGNLRSQGAKSVEESKDEDGSCLCSVDFDRALLFGKTKERMYERGKTAFYLRICYRGPS